MTIENTIKYILYGVLFLVALNIFTECNREKVELDPVNKKITYLQNRLDSLEQGIYTRIDSIQVINKINNYHKTIYKNELNEIDSIQNVDSLRSFIRSRIISLESARLQ